MDCSRSLVCPNTVCLRLAFSPGSPGLFLYTAAICTYTVQALPGGHLQCGTIIHPIVYKLAAGVPSLPSHRTRAVVVFLRALPRALPARAGRGGRRARPSRRFRPMCAPRIVQRKLAARAPSGAYWPGIAGQRTELAGLV